MVKQMKIVKTSDGMPKIVTDKVVTKEKINFWKYWCLEKIFLENGLNLQKEFEEHSYVVAIEDNWDIKYIYELSKGSNVESTIYINELFRFLLLIGRDHFVLVHNHPSNIAEFSNDDTESDKLVLKCAEFFKMTFEDSCIITKEGCLTGKKENYPGAKWRWEE